MVINATPWLTTAVRAAICKIWQEYQMKMERHWIKTVGPRDNNSIDSMAKTSV